MNENLYIYDGDETHLPFEFHFSHNLCVRMHDDLVSILTDKGVVKNHGYTVKFKENDPRPAKNEHDILDWLVKHGFTKQVDEIVSRNLLFAIVSDMCHFIFQSLMSSKKMKLTVAFNLMRKPFLENLLVIEQLLADEEKFLRKFELDPSKFDPGKVSDNEKRELINKVTMLIHKNYLLDPDLIFDIRFDKSNANSIYANANLATHLVTNRHSSYLTESQNMNFIFSSFDEWDTQLEYIYYFLPYLLYYTTELIDEYLLKKKLITKKAYNSRKFFRLIGQLLQQNQFDKEPKGKKGVNEIVKFFKIKCKDCKKLNQLFVSDLFCLVHHDYLLCKHCLSDLKHETKSFEDIISKFMK
jgi:hypothetical protein